MSKPKVVIKRNKWRCGGVSGVDRIGEGLTKLRNQEGFMCCLGFAAKQLGGLTDKDLASHSTPGFRAIPHLSEELRNLDYTWFRNTKLSKEALKINDRISLSTSEREEKLTALFKEHGVGLRFVNKYLRKDREK